MIDRAIEAELTVIAPEKVISGMARGVDTIAARVSRRLKIPYVAAVPFLAQVSNHSDEDRAEWMELLEGAEDIQIVCDGDYAVWKFQKRNEWMVDNSQLVLAVWDGSRGGTANCVKYAQRVGRDIRYLDWNSGTFVTR